jgi:IS30 family transposase
MGILLSKIEFAKKIGVSVSTINRGIKRNLWPYNAFITLGNRVRYSEVLVEYIVNDAHVKAIGGSQSAPNN